MNNLVWNQSGTAQTICGQTQSWRTDRTSPSAGQRCSGWAFKGIFVRFALRFFAQFRLEQPPTPASATPNPTHPAFKTAHESGTIPPTLGATNPAEFYPAISATLNTSNPGAVQWAQTRPTLTGGIPSGRMSG